MDSVRELSDGTDAVMLPGETTADPHAAETFEDLTALAVASLREQRLADPGDTILILGGVPARQPKGTNFIKLHTIA